MTGQEVGYSDSDDESGIIITHHIAVLCIP